MEKYDTENLPANVGDKSLAETEKQVPMITNNFEEELNKMISMAGTIELTESQKEILYAPIDDDLIEIRPDGMIYLPWMEYVSRLKQTFGLSWQAIPQGMPKFQGNHIYWGYYLVIQGKFAGFAIGEQEYQPKNYGMSYGDAVEGAKSNALMRLCKGVGIGLELWQPSFIKRWKAKYAETYYNKEKQKNYWRRKEAIDQEIANEFLEKLKVELIAIQSIAELNKKYLANKAKYESSEMKDTIIKMFESCKHQLTLETIADLIGGGIVASDIEQYLETAGESDSADGLIAESLLGNKDAIKQLKTQVIDYIELQKKMEAEKTRQEELDLKAMEDAGASE